MKPIYFFLIFIFVAVFSYSQEKITLLFAGDLMQHKAQIDVAKTCEGRYDYTDCFKYVKEEISRADVAIANLEVTFGGKPYKGYPAFSAPDEYLYAIKDAGFDILLTANNHCLDTGKKGMERTIMMLDSLKIPHIGTYMNKEMRGENTPLLINKNGFRIALLNYTYGTNGIEVQFPNVVNYINKEVMKRDIVKSKSYRPDAIVVCIHWGIEYQSMPDREQKELADWLLAQGVSHIIGSHPHVLQPMERRKRNDSFEENIVVYSLGNFISNMSVRRTDGGAMFWLELKKRNRIVRIDNCGYRLVWTSRPNLNGKKKFILYPVPFPKEKLMPMEANMLSIFEKDSKRLFDEHNMGIKEYIFE